MGNKTILYRQIGKFLYGLSDEKKVNSRNPEDVDLVFRYSTASGTKEEEVDFFYFYDGIDDKGNRINQSGKYYVRGTIAQSEDAISKIKQLKKDNGISAEEADQGILKVKTLSEKGYQYFLIEAPTKYKHLNVEEVNEEDKTLEDLGIVSKKIPQQAVKEDEPRKKVKEIKQKSYISNFNNTDYDQETFDEINRWIRHGKY